MLLIGEALIFLLSQLQHLHCCRRPDPLLIQQQVKSLEASYSFLMILIDVLIELKALLHFVQGSTLYVHNSSKIVRSHIYTEDVPIGSARLLIHWD